ncbi:IS200/IS605 family transposase [Prolixibacter sp. SD074]|jgi:REP element-mobilizing transposase RayT|uniref:IS200/IS605 family transposase n=1 Tax=Prolixibacter sp. SD074 TaxID=2652391 RepID=UPI001274A1B0|nr:IS200/IS605 family transposase [Prolixibacter sp. SD074]GET29356.1 transposase [Prolixibacter sp. SD074]GET29513.1 transposase [Prolixibacter sp. SD074]
MGQSLAQLYVHLIFGTKERYPFVSTEIKPAFEAYITGIFKNLNSPTIIVYANPDHVHILFRLSKNHALAKIVEEVKKSSSKWMKEKGVRKFVWQIGYAAFSVSSSKLDSVKRYIQNQQEHHRRISFQEEIETFMGHYRISEYDGSYFWA